MTQRTESAMSAGRRLSHGLIGFVLLLMPYACGGQSAATDDSETHFLHCDVTSDCRELGPEFICHEQECRDRSEVEADAGSSSPSGGAGGSSSFLPTAGTGGTSPSVPRISDKLDLLLMIDNSVSMADKQQMLRAAVPDLVGRLVNPACVDLMGQAHLDVTPASVEDSCPQGLHREFEPINDINIAVVTSSLGAFGSTSGACENSDNFDQKEDMAHLVGSLPRATIALDSNPVVDAQGFGILEWRGTGREDLEAGIDGLVNVAGEFGCGYEASLESWYRFLVDPEPYLELAQVSCTEEGTDTNCRAPMGIDQSVIDQRAAFLRPDSLVAIVMLTDENDCSVRVTGQNWYVAQVGAEFPMWRSAAICETDPNNTCCYSCGQLPPEGCAPDVVCGDTQNTREATDYYLDDQGRKSVEDQDNLRCFHQKQRFGIDFLHSTDRYSNALSQAELCLSNDDLSLTDCEADRIVPNPLYSDGSTRDSSMVFLMGIVGVPWQDLARNTDLDQPLQYKTYDELQQGQAWDLILGDGVTAGDPLMRESITPRSGDQPIVEQALAPTAGGHMENAINGHEWEPNPPSDLQYACIFPLPEERDCAALRAADDPRHCDCDGAVSTAAGQQSKPLCQDPNGAYGTTQYYAKAYPGIRELQVLQQHGAATGNSVVSSICARNVTDPTAQDYGYRPAVASLIERLAPHLPTPQ